MVPRQAGGSVAAGYPPPPPRSGWSRGRGSPARRCAAALGPMPFWPD